LTLICAENGVTPDAVAESQLESLLKVPERPAVEEDIDAAWLAGWVPPATAVKVIVVGVTVTWFCEGAVTVTDTGRTNGVFVAPNEATLRVVE
jgi:hypothetical protein